MTRYSEPGGGDHLFNVEPGTDVIVGHIAEEDDVDEGECEGDFETEEGTTVELLLIELGGDKGV